MAKVGDYTKTYTAPEMLEAAPHGAEVVIGRSGMDLAGDQVGAYGALDLGAMYRYRTDHTIFNYGRYGFTFSFTDEKDLAKENPDAYGDGNTRGDGDCQPTLPEAGLGADVSAADVLEAITATGYDVDGSDDVMSSSENNAVLSYLASHYDKDGDGILTDAELDPDGDGVYDFSQDFPNGTTIEPTCGDGSSLPTKYDVPTLFNLRAEGGHEWDWYIGDKGAEHGWIWGLSVGLYGQLGIPLSDSPMLIDATRASLDSSLLPTLQGGLTAGVHLYKLPENIQPHETVFIPHAAVTGDVGGGLAMGKKPDGNMTNIIGFFAPRVLFSVGGQFGRYSAPTGSTPPPTPPALPDIDATTAQTKLNERVASITERYNTKLAAAGVTFEAIPVPPGETDARVPVGTTTFVLRLDGYNTTGWTYFINKTEGGTTTPLEGYNLGRLESYITATYP